MKVHNKLALVFGRNLSRERQRLGLTQGEMGSKLGISQVYVHYLEEGLRVPSLDMITAIAFKLGRKPLDMLKE